MSKIMRLEHINSDDSLKAVLCVCGQLNIPLPKPEPAFAASAPNPPPLDELPPPKTLPPLLEPKLLLPPELPKALLLPPLPKAPEPPNANTSVQKMDEIYPWMMKGELLDHDTFSREHERRKHVICHYLFRVTAQKTDRKQHQSG